MSAQTKRGTMLERCSAPLVARILDCSWETWRVEGRPWTMDASTPRVTNYSLPDEDRSIRAGHTEVESAIDDPACGIVDVRSEAEYRGERFWPSGGMEQGGRAGHVPSAVLVPFDDVRDEKGAFLSAVELRSLASTIDASDASEIITYCTIGGRASTAWFVLTYLLGRRNVRVYDGSWAEWGRMPTTPVAVP